MRHQQRLQQARVAERLPGEGGNQNEHHEHILYDYMHCTILHRLYPLLALPSPQAPMELPLTAS